MVSFQIANTQFPKELKQKLASTLASYIPLCGTFSFILRDRLEAVQKEFDLDAEASSSTEPKDLKAGIGTTRQQDFSVSEFEASVADEPVVYTRAGLYVYLNAMVSFVKLNQIHCFRSPGYSLKQA